MLHYLDAIRRLGSADGYNTESPERLHIDFAKEAYRASNKRDYTEQMALWLQRQEAIDLRTAYLDWITRGLQQASSIDNSQEDLDDDEDDNEDVAGDIIPAYTLAKTSPFPHTTVTRLETDFGATRFLPALTTYIQQNVPSHSAIQPSARDRFDAFKQITVPTSPNFHLSSKPQVNRIRTTPATSAQGRKAATPAHFDTALIQESPGASSTCFTIAGVAVPY